MESAVDRDSLNEYTQKLTAKFKTMFAARSAIGSPLVASTAAAMTDTTRIYVYTGSETGYNFGDWYYYDGSWKSGGLYNTFDPGVITDDEYDAEIAEALTG